MILCEHQGIETGALPPAPKLQSIGTVELNEFAPLLIILHIAEKHRAAVPESMEYFGQNFGLIYYETVLSGKYDLSPIEFRNVHDFGYVYFDGKLKKRIDRTQYTVKKKGIQSLFGLKRKKIFDARAQRQPKDRRFGRQYGSCNYGDQIMDRKGMTDI